MSWHHIHPVHQPLQLSPRTLLLPAVVGAEADRMMSSLGHCPSPRSLFSRVLYKHSCLRGMLAWENIKLRVNDLSSPPHTPSYWMWETGMLSAGSPIVLMSAIPGLSAFWLGPGVPGLRDQPCKALQVRQELRWQVTPEMTCGKFWKGTERRAGCLLSLGDAGWRLVGRKESM